MEVERNCMSWLKPHISKYIRGKNPLNLRDQSTLLLSSMVFGF